MKNFTQESITNDPKIQDFLYSRPLKKRSMENYLIQFREYSNFMGMLPKDWLREAEEEQDRGIRSRDRKIRRHLIAYSKFLEEKNRSLITIERKVTDMKTLYHDFDIDTPKIRLKKPKASSSFGDLPTMDEIKKAVRNVTTRDRAIILLAISSGMTGNEIRNLTYDDFLTAINLPKNTQIYEIRDKLPENPVPIWEIERGKTEYEHITFSTPEAVNAIIDYLEERNYHTEALFTGQNRKEHISRSAFTSLFERTNDKLGFGWKKNGKSRRLTSHNLRRFFASQLFSTEKIEKVKIDYMLSHIVDKTSEAYFKANPNALRKEYMKTMSVVSTEKLKYTEVTDRDYQKALERIQELEKHKKDMERTKNLIEELLSNEKVLEELQKNRL